VSKLVARYRAEGEAAFIRRSRRPRTSSTRLSQTVIDLILELRQKLTASGLDAGPLNIAWHLEQHYKLNASAASISRYLVKAAVDAVELRPG
jgi:hypothetical protein